MNNLDAIKASLYQAALGDQNWSNVAAGLRHLVRSDLLALSTTDRATGQPVMIYGDCSPYYTRLYQALNDDNPFLPALKTLQQGQVVTDRLLLDRKSFVRTNFFDIWMRPQRQHSAAVMNLFSRSSNAIYFMFSRGGRTDRFSERETDALNALQPTLRHAMELHSRLAQGRLEQTGRVLDGQAIGWLAVEATGRISWFNEKAEALLAGQGGALTARHAMLRAYDSRQTQRLLKALHGAVAGHARVGQGSNIVFRNPETAAAIAVSVVPADNVFVRGLPEIHGAYLALQDLSPRLPDGLGARIGEMFELTPREAELAIALAGGQTVAESAASRGLSMPTVRTQLAQLLRKTGTSRQSQLVALLLSTLPVPFVG